MTISFKNGYEDYNAEVFLGYFLDYLNQNFRAEI